MSLRCRKVSGRCLEGVWKVSGTLPNLPISTQLTLPNQPNLTNSTNMTKLTEPWTFQPYPTQLKSFGNKIFCGSNFSGSKFVLYTNFFRTQIFWNWNFWGPKFLVHYYFSTQILLGPQHFRDQNFSRTQFFFQDPHFLGTQIFQDPNFFTTKICGFKVFWDK